MALVLLLLRRQQRRPRLQQAHQALPQLEFPRRLAV
jgi:hypothetical protein